MPTSCGPPGCSPRMPGNMGPPPGIRAWRCWPRGRCARSWPRKTSSHTRACPRESGGALLPGTARSRVRARDGRNPLCLPASGDAAWARRKGPRQQQWRKPGDRFLRRERLDHPQFRRALLATCYCLLRHPNRARHGISRWVLQIGQNDPRPFDPARRRGTRPRNLQQTLPLLRITRQRDHPARCDHWIPQSNPHPASYHISSKMRSKTQHIDILESLY
jgi:hypothetical protein